jgi:hypothetical protein
MSKKPRIQTPFMKWFKEKFNIDLTTHHLNGVKAELQEHGSGKTKHMLLPFDWVCEMRKLQQQNAKMKDKIKEIKEDIVI